MKDLSVHFFLVPISISCPFFILVSSVVDPYHFELDPDPNRGKFQLFFFNKKYYTQNDIFFVFIGL